jgi:hypothetical protein
VADDLVIVALRVLPTAPRHWDTDNACHLRRRRRRRGEQVISRGK